MPRRGPAPGWFRYKLARPLTEEEVEDLRALAGPILGFSSLVTVSVHENCAWLFERWAQAHDLGARCVLSSPAPQRLVEFPQLDGLREWVKDFCTDYQREFVLVHGNRDGVFCILGTGCLTGDTLVQINRGGKSYTERLDTIVAKFNGGGVRKWDLSIPTMAQSNIGGFVRLNRIVAAVESGVKPVFRLTTATGEQIKATADHVFFTPDGEFPLRDLRVGGTVLRAEWPTASGKKRDRSGGKWYVQVHMMRHHPQATKRTKVTKAGTIVNGYALRQNCVSPFWTVPQHRLVIEAEINGLDYLEFVSRVRAGRTEGLVFLDPSVHVHHKDRNPQNNARSNLEVLSEAAHLRLHADEGGWKHVSGRFVATTIESIEYVGEEPTYDLTMESPHNSFVANGLLVHNSGKTLLGIIYGLMRPGLVVFITRAGARRTVASEIRRFTTFEPFVIEGGKVDEIPEGTRFVVVGWESLATYAPVIIRANPVTMIADESHLAKSHKRYEAIIERNTDTNDTQRDEKGEEKVTYRRLNNRFGAAEAIADATEWHLALTATPIRDRIRDLWAQLDLLMRRGWGGFYKWCYRYADAKESPWGGIDTTGSPRPEQMKELLARLSFSTYYVPQSVTHRNLPPKRRQVTYIKAHELTTGRDVLSELREHGYHSATGEVWAKLALAAAMKRNRTVEEAAAGAYRAPDGRQGGKVVVFTGLRKDCEKIAAALKQPRLYGGKDKVPTIFVGHGGMEPKLRDRVREEYMAHPGPCILVGTIDSWGESINLQDTDLAIMSMLPFTPGQIRQAEGRFVRQGMTRPCLILYLVAESTADEHVAMALLSKLPAVESVAKDEVLIEFGKDLKGDEEEIVQGMLSKMLAETTDDEVEA